MQNRDTAYAVLMSVYAKEQANHFRSALDSMLAQTLPPSQFVLVCDGALTDALEAVIRDTQSKLGNTLYLVRLRENSGLGVALNTGLAHCNFEYVARMDTDDIALPQRCETQLRFMNERSLDLVSAAVEEFDPQTGVVTGCRRLPETHAALARFARHRNPMNHPAVMFRKSMVEKAGGYERVPYFEDYDLWIRMLQAGARLGNCPAILLRMRAGSSLYQRRGGLTYCRDIRFFYSRLRKEGFLSPISCWFYCTLRCAVSLTPLLLRKTLYRKALRTPNARNSENDFTNREIEKNHD